MKDEGVFGSVSRRAFVTSAATLATASFLGGCAPQQPLGDTGEEPEVQVEIPETVYKNGFCRGGCCSNCFQKVHVRDGQIVRVTAGDVPTEGYRGICSKGLSEPARVYSENRLQYPMKRVGERGEGKFERISWDEALSTIAENWKKITDEYGPSAFSILSGAGNMAVLNGGSTLGRLGNITGASTVSTPVDQAYVYGAAATVGLDLFVGGSAYSLIDQAKTVVCWGANPAVSNIQDFHWLLDARDKGIPFVVIDPVCGPVACKADWYVPINPSTDGALALGILKVILDEGKEDKEFCRTATNSTYLVKNSDGMFLRMSDLGVEPAVGEDGQPIDPVAVWDEADGAAKPFDEAATPSLEGVAEVNGIAVKTVYTITKEAVAEYTLEKTTEITGVPADSIKKLADIYANGPVATNDFLGPDHYDNGHYNYVCMNTMMLMTHNVGRPGAMMRRGYAFSVLGTTANTSFPTDAAGNPCQGSGPSYPSNRLNEILDTGKFNGEDAVMKGLYVYASGFLAVGTNRTEMVKALEKLDFIAVCDVWMTETVSYADIVLPACGWYESIELFNSQSIHPYIMYQDPVIEPLYESKNGFQISKLIAEALGYGEFFDLTEEDFLRAWLDTDMARSVGVTFDAVREAGVMHGWPVQEFQCGENGVFATADTRATIYREQPYVHGVQEARTDLDPSKELSVYWEPAAEADVKSKAREKFPFQAMNEHMRTRTHTQWYDVGQLKEYYPEPYARMNPDDAEELGIVEGDTIKLYNDRGFVVMKATISSGYPRKMIGIPRGHMKKEFIDGHFCDISSDAYNQVCANQAFSDQAVAIEKL